MTFIEQVFILLIFLLFAKDLVVAYAKKKGWINGKNGKDIEGLKNQLSSLQDNHLHDLSDKLDKLSDKVEEHNKMEYEVLFILKEIKDKLK